MSGRRRLPRAAAVVLLARTIAWMALTRAVTAAAPFAWWRRWLAEPASTGGCGSRRDAAVVRRALGVAQVVMPGARCLPRALVARRIACKCGQCGRVRIGAHRDASGLRFHAWLESEDEIVVGGEAAVREQAVLTGGRTIGEKRA